MWAEPNQNQTTRQFNAKAVWNVGDHRFGAFAATSRVSRANYAYLSKSMLERGPGWDWNIYAPDWDRARRRLLRAGHLQRTALRLQRWRQQHRRCVLPEPRCAMTTCTRWMRIWHWATAPA